MTISPGCRGSQLLIIWSIRCLIQFLRRVLRRIKCTKQASISVSPVAWRRYSRRWRDIVRGHMTRRIFTMATAATSATWWLLLVCLHTSSAIVRVMVHGIVYRRFEISLKMPFLYLWVPGGAYANLFVWCHWSYLHISRWWLMHVRTFTCFSSLMFDLEIAFIGLLIRQLLVVQLEIPRLKITEIKKKIVINLNCCICLKKNIMLKQRFRQFCKTVFIA